MGPRRCRVSKLLKCGCAIPCECLPMLSRDAVSLDPRANGMHRNAPRLGDGFGRTGALHDVRVSMHSAIVHYALPKHKCLLHQRARYVDWMNDTPGDRLKSARIAAGYGSTVDAAAALGVSQSTYAQHENGIRGIPKDKAPLYARRFKVTEEWLLYGKGADKLVIPEGAEPAAPIPLLGDVPAGPWREAIGKTRQYVPAPAAGIPTSAYALKVTGDSMDKVVRDGATIIIDPTDFDLFEKRLFVVRNGDGDVTFKQYREGPARLVPCSNNDEHKEIPITDKGFQIVGRVIKIVLDPDQAALN